LRGKGLTGIEKREKLHVARRKKKVPDTESIRNVGKGGAGVEATIRWGTETAAGEI